MIKAPVSLQNLRRKIYAKAKADPSWRFWGLYVHVCKLETLRTAYAMAKANDGAPGIDGVTFDAIEAAGVDGFLAQLRDELVTFRYRPLRNRQREIPKEGTTKVRILSIPAIRDRVVQGALKLILEPIFEADFQPGSFGYRPKRTAHAAVKLVADAIVRHKTRIIDLDVRAYFDNVRHSRLLEKVAARVNDDEVMHLLKMMLKATGDKGVPQGGVSTARTQKVTSVLSEIIGPTRQRRAAPVRRSRWHGNAVAEHDRIIANEHLLDHQAHDTLPFDHVERVGGSTQPREKLRERLRQPEVRGPLLSLLGNRLQLGAQPVLPLA